MNIHNNKITIFGSTLIHALVKLIRYSFVFLAGGTTFIPFGIMPMQQHASMAPQFYGHMNELCIPMERNEIQSVIIYMLENISLMTFWFCLTDSLAARVSKESTYINFFGESGFFGLALYPFASKKIPHCEWI